MPNPKNEKQVFAAPRRSQEDIQQMLVKETMTFDQLNCALSEAGKKRKHDIHLFTSNVQVRNVIPLLLLCVV